MNSLQLAQLIADNPAIAAMGQQYPQMADALNAPTEVANKDAGKETTTTTPTPIMLKGVMALVPPAEGAKILERPAFFDSLRDAIDANDREYLAYLLSVAVAGSYISANTAQALAPLLTATTTTTTTQPAKIPGPSIASAAGLGVVTAADVQAADIASNGLWYRGAA